MVVCTVVVKSMIFCHPVMGNFLLINDKADLEKESLSISCNYLYIVVVARCV